jgi:hypothetical protein
MYLANKARRTRRITRGFVDGQTGAVQNEVQTLGHIWMQFHCHEFIVLPDT